MKIMKMAATGGQPDTGMPAKNSVLAENMDSTIAKAVYGAGYGPASSPTMPKKSAAIVNTMSVEEFLAVAKGANHLEAVASSHNTTAAELKNLMKSSEQK
jgi:hypothetical protein